MKTELNLLPVHQKRNKTPQISQRKVWIVIVAVAVVAFLVAYGVLGMLDRICLERIQQVDEVLAQKRDGQLVDQNIAAQKELLMYRNKLWEALLQNQDLSQQALLGVYDALPSGMNLIAYTYTEGKLKVSGSTRNQEDIFHFKEQLMTKENVANVSIQNTAKRTVTGSENTVPASAAANGDSWEFTFEIELTTGENT